MSAEDKAQELEAKYWEINNMNRNHLPKAAQPGDPNYGPEECNECGEEMHPVRRSHGFTLCFNCATEEESRLTRKRG